MNLFRQLALLLLWLSTSQLNAQFGKNCELRQVKVNLLNPGLEYEMALGTNTTFDIKAGLQFALDPLLPDVYKELAFLPAIAGQYRYSTTLGAVKGTEGRSTATRPIMWHLQPPCFCQVPGP